MSEHSITNTLEVNEHFEAIVAENFNDGVTEIANADIAPAVLSELEATPAQKTGPKPDAGYGGRWND